MCMYVDKRSPTLLASRNLSSKLLLELFRLLLGRYLFQQVEIFYVTANSRRIIADKISQKKNFGVNSVHQEELINQDSCTPDKLCLAQTLFDELEVLANCAWGWTGNSKPPSQQSLRESNVELQKQVAAMRLSQSQMEKFQQEMLEEQRDLKQQRSYQNDEDSVRREREAELERVRARRQGTAAIYAFKSVLS